ncbi:hypothetical protein [Adlercreutzia sp. ZJ138]|uniref:hypothetical protein n=1 Tax=Adlercreutzia sp. ZJ138 TaxID=2709405 RepID=UPI0013EB2F70|nr:hypothetical protein [Adlercreutzia sp. ZJ138]
MTTPYVPYQAMHLVFSEPEKGIADGQLFTSTGEREVYITSDDGTYTVLTFAGEEVGSGTSVAAALKATGADGWDFCRWDAAYDSQFSTVQDEDTWDPDYLREVAEDENILTDELEGIISAYEQNA